MASLLNFGEGYLFAHHYQAAEAPGIILATLPPDQTVTNVATGLYHTCALLDDATVFCFGDNRLGQLGLMAPSPAALAARPPEGVLAGVVDLQGDRVAAIAAGAYHTCALLEDGGVRCWGWNDDGQLGDANRPSGDASPGLIVPVDLGKGRRALAVSAGAFHTCAVTDDREAMCGGQDSGGQIGVLRAANPNSVPPGTPVDLGPGRTVYALAAGGSHTCAVLDDNSVKCWGFNGDGQLGLAHTRNLGDDEPLGDALSRSELGSGAVSQISAGAQHTCAVQGTQIKCWGQGRDGRLGAGDSKNRGDSPGHPIVGVEVH